VRVHVTQHAGHAVVRPSGELDTASAQELGEAIRLGFEKGLPLVVLDLSAVTFIDSTATSALLQENSAANEQGLSLRLAAPSAPVTRVLAMLGVDDVLDMRATVEDALAG
jgi:anti-anti-sigma factor